MNKIAKMILDMARFYGEALDDRQVELYVEVLSNFDEQTVLMCGAKYMVNYKNEKFPKPIHKIMEGHIQQVPDSVDLARDTALRIRQAITKFGWNKAGKAKEFIGEAGWNIVERFGGWMYLCENLGVKIQEATFYAQCRDAIQSQINLERAGINTNLPSIEQSKGKAQIMGVVKKLTDKISLTGGKDADRAN